jgi:hypothetical protein
MVISSDLSFAWEYGRKTESKAALSGKAVSKGSGLM